MSSRSGGAEIRLLHKKIRDDMFCLLYGSTFGPHRIPVRGRTPKPCPWRRKGLPALW